jgi:hypothetical protein
MIDAELYGAYLQKLGTNNGNPTFYRLKEMFSVDATGNYEALMVLTVKTLKHGTPTEELGLRRELPRPM